MRVDIWDRLGIVAILGLALGALGFTLCTRGIVLSDEGYLLLQSWDMAQGKVLYRDMDSFVTPGVWFLLAGLFKVFEPSVFVSRMAVLACFVATAGVSARIAQRLAGPVWALGVIFGYAVVAVWGFPAWTWSFYSVYAVLFALAALERLLAWRERQRAIDLAWVGAFLALSVVFKQNYGAQALLGAALGFAAIRLEVDRSPVALLRVLPRAMGLVALGSAPVVLPVVGYFALHGALGDAFDALAVRPFTSFLDQHIIPYLPLSEFFERNLVGGFGRLTYGAFGLNHGDLSYTWWRPAVRGVELLHVLLYWIPPLFFGLGGVVLLLSLREGQPDGGLAALLAVGGLLFLGVFPRADLNHLINVYQPVIVVAAVVLQRLTRRRAALTRAARWGAMAFGGAVLACYAGVAVYWYGQILDLLDAELPQPRGGVLLSRENRDMINYEVAKIRENTEPGEPVLTLPALAMLNFLAERPMPSRYYNHYAVHISHDGGRKLAEALEAERIRLILADYYGFFSETVGLREYAPELTHHIRRHFTPLISVGVDDHLFLARRSEPLPDLETESVLADCDVGFHDWRSRGIQQHLLFDILYHPLQSGILLLRRQAETLCRVVVPPGADLAFSVGYRQPMRVAPRTTLVGEIWIRRLGRPDEPMQPIYREKLRPRPVTGWNSPPHLERRLDLGPWEGEAVWLVFRTLYEGDARMNPLGFKGFAMIWQDPQLEFPRSSARADEDPPG